MSRLKSDINPIFVIVIQRMCLSSNKIMQTNYYLRAVARLNKLLIGGVWFYAKSTKYHIGIATNYACIMWQCVKFQFNSGIYRINKKLHTFLYNFLIVRKQKYKRHKKVTSQLENLLEPSPSRSKTIFICDI